MKKAVFLIMLIVVSIETFGQNIPLRQIKGKWLSESVCIIASQVPLNTPSTLPENINRPVIMVSFSPNNLSTTVTRWLIDNYHFDMRIVKFLFIHTYKIKSTNGEISHLVAKGKYTYDEENKKFTLRNLRMETNECNKLINLDTTIYSVIMINDNLMVWSPDGVTDYTKAYLESIRWRR